uniref:Uncharacterized protein n=1 Tax=Mycena chlorophos TaxID=658473 RepID=A0ABQ0M888_MYCCL|nr:predicted protein [Mycena chlorophos]
MAHQQQQAQTFRRHVPLITYQTRQPTPPQHGGQPIPFDYVDNRAGGLGMGVWMNDLRFKGPEQLNTIIRGGDYQLDPSIERIMLRIIWPGYEGEEDAGYITLSKNNRRITLSELGTKIADRMCYFFQNMKSTYPTVPPSPTQFPIVPTGVLLEHLYLGQLVNTVGNVWQADIALDIRKPGDVRFSGH